MQTPPLAVKKKKARKPKVEVTPKKSAVSTEKTYRSIVAAINRTLDMAAEKGRGPSKVSMEELLGRKTADVVPRIADRATKEAAVEAENLRKALDKAAITGKPAKLAWG